MLFSIHCGFTYDLSRDIALIMDQTLDLAISPCPNDTFIFFDFLKKYDLEQRHALHFADVEELNQRAIHHGRHVLTKLSFYAYLKIRDRYTLLSAGGAMGRGCGPLLVRSSTAEDINAEGAKPGNPIRILIPGQYTTANLLLRLFMNAVFPEQTVEYVHTVYHEIIPALKNGLADYGVIIHEERFTYKEQGLHLLRDLGQWWESATQMPIPLGAIAVRNDAIRTWPTICRLSRRTW